MHEFVILMLGGVISVALMCLQERSQAVSDKILRVIHLLVPEQKREFALQRCLGDLNDPEKNLSGLYSVLWAFGQIVSVLGTRWKNRQSVNNDLWILFAILTMVNAYAPLYSLPDHAKTGDLEIFEKYKFHEYVAVFLSIPWMWRTFQKMHSLGILGLFVPFSLVMLIWEVIRSNPQNIDPMLLVMVSTSYIVSIIDDYPRFKKLVD